MPGNQPSSRSLSPLTSKLVRQIPKVYDAICLEYDRKWSEFYLHTELEEFVSLLPKKGKILDAGCGHGRDALYFASLGFEVTAIDVSEKMVELTRRKSNMRNLPIEVEKRDMSKPEDMDFSDVDGIWSCASFSHIPPELHLVTLGNFHSSLKRRGILWFSVRNLEDPPVRSKSEEWSSKGLRFKENEFGEYVTGNGRYMVAMATPYLRMILGRSKFEVLRMRFAGEWVNFLARS